MAQLSKVVNATLISQIGLYLEITSEVCSVILMRKGHENLFHQNLLVFLIKEKTSTEEVKISTENTIG